MEKHITKIITNIETVNNYYGGCVSGYDFRCPECNGTSEIDSTKKIQMKNKRVFSPLVCCHCGHKWMYGFDIAILDLILLPYYMIIIAGVIVLGIGLLVGLHYLCEGIGTSLSPLF